MPPRGSHPHRQHRSSKDGRALRPKTSPGFQQLSARKGSVQQAVNKDDEAVAEDDIEEEHIELLEYEWPDLPPIPSMKDAVSRRRVSQGISYLLPVDKGRNSINNRFRTDLRAMFQEPYASDNFQYDDNRVKLSAKVHFLSNTADTKWTPHLLNSIPTQLNADSESARKLYVHSAPSGGVASRRMGIDPNKLRKRSNLFLPVKASKAQVSPEIVKLRQEAGEIIKQGLAYKDEDDRDLGQEETANANLQSSNNFSASLFTNTANPLQPAQNNLGHSGEHRKSLVSKPEGHMLSTFGGSALNDTLGTSALNLKLQNVRIHQEKYNDYEDLRNALPPKPQIPQDISSPFLSQDTNQRVWEWLHYGQSMRASVTTISMTTAGSSNRYNMDVIFPKLHINLVECGL